MLLAVTDIVWNAVIAAIVAIILKWFDYRSQKRMEITGKKLDGVEVKVDDVHKATNGLTTKIETAALKEGLARGSMEERDRALREKEAIARGASEERLLHENGIISKNVEVVKKDIQEVKGDVKDVKAAGIHGTTQNMSTNPKTGD